MNECSLIFDPPIVALDVDNTLIESNFPRIIKPKPYCFWLLNELEAAGWRRILFTCREGQYLDHVNNWFKERGFEFDAYNDNSALTEEEWNELGFTDTRKLGYDVIVDDKSVFWQDNLKKVGEILLDIYDQRRDKDEKN